MGYIELFIVPNVPHINHTARNHQKELNTRFLLHPVGTFVDPSTRLAVLLICCINASFEINTMRTRTQKGPSRKRLDGGIQGTHKRIHSKNNGNATGTMNHKPYFTPISTPLHCLKKMHFQWTIPGPDSSYSSRVTHISLNVDSEERIEPPIHTEYFRSAGATTRILIEAGANVVSSLDKRSLIPGNIVDPPDSTAFVYSSRRISMSHF